jgi:hypothetical protein
VGFALPQENHLPGDIWNGSMREMPPDEVTNWLASTGFFR